MAKVTNKFVEKKNAAPKTPKFIHHIADALRAAGYTPEELDLYRADVLAFLPPEEEKKIKLAAIRQLWKYEHLRCYPTDVVMSPMPRHYRTTSKRRAFYSHGKFALEMGYVGKKGGGNGDELEAELHNRIYALLQQSLSQKKNEEIAKSLNYCILRGSYTEAALILNVYRVNGDVVRRCKALADELRKEVPELISMFLFLDETKSEYYLESSARMGKARLFKKFFGPDHLVQKLHDKKLFYTPDVFSQVNSSMCETFADTALALLRPAPGAHVIDLYCGYGLLALRAAMDVNVNSITGMDWEGPSIRSATSNAEHLFPAKNIRFLAGAVTSDALKDRLPPPSGKEYVILDPPRQGAAAGVLEAIAARRPERIVHIFCGTDTISAALHHWHANGYDAKKVRVLDMFPGSANVETLVLLERQ